MKILYEIFRFLVLTILSLINAILCSAIVVETTHESNIAWAEMPTTQSFSYLLWALFCLLFFSIIDYIIKYNQTKQTNKSLLNQLSHTCLYLTFMQEFETAIKNNDKQKFDNLKSFAEELTGE